MSEGVVQVEYQGHTQVVWTGTLPTEGRRISRSVPATIVVYVDCDLTFIVSK